MSRSIPFDCQADIAIYKLMEMIDGGIFLKQSWILLKSVVKCRMEYVSEKLVSFLMRHLSSNSEDVIDIIDGIVENTSVINIPASFKDLLLAIKKDVIVDKFDQYVNTLINRGFYSYMDLLNNC